MRLAQTLLIATCVLSISVLSCKKPEDDIPPLPSATATAQPSQAPTPATTELQNPAGPASIVKPELDGRADGTPGTPLVVPGAKASVQLPAGWQTTKGEVQVVSAADQKSRFAATNFGPEGVAGKLDKAAAASGLTACQWGGPQSLIVGKDKLATQAADGTCQRNGAPVTAAYMGAEGLLVVGSWDAGVDRTPLFGSMRTLAKLAGGGDASGIAACCAALQQNAKSAPPAHVPYYMTAIGVCNSLRNNPQGKAALGQVRAALGAAAVPAQCR